MERARSAHVAIAICVALLIFANRPGVKQESVGDKTSSATFASEENVAQADDVTVVCLGDSHSKHANFKIPPGDVLLHSGDFSMFGRKSDIVAFNDWLGKLPHRYKIVVAGNHDSGRTGNRLIFKELKQLLTNAV